MGPGSRKYPDDNFKANHSSHCTHFSRQCTTLILVDNEFNIALIKPSNNVMQYGIDMRSKFRFKYMGKKKWRNDLSREFHVSKTKVHNILIHKSVCVLRIKGFLFCFVLFFSVASTSFSHKLISSFY